ncbi:MAG: SpoIIE family protein phosphatase [Firmicutes bacterium]|nr:SpoIIE family protein phosphatase [Bacillota bacterium]
MDRVKKWPYTFPFALKRQAVWGRLDWNKVFWLLASFFLGRASLLGEVAPFALIFWALVLHCCPQRKAVVTAFLFLGWVTAEAGTSPPWLLPATMLLWAVLDLVLQKLLQRKIALSFLLPLSIILLRLPLFYQQYYTIYEMAIVILEVSLAVLLPPLLKPFLIELEANRGGKLSPEAIAGGILFLFLMLLGMHGLVFGGKIVVSNVVCPLLILAGAYLWGPIWGVISGLIVGLGLSFGQPVMFSYTGVLSIAGLTTGLLRPYRRIWMALGFFFILRFLAHYLAEGGYILTSPIEDLLVVCIFLFVPVSAWQKLKELGVLCPFRLEDEQKLRFSMAARVKEFAAVFKELAVTFRPLSKAEEVRVKKDLSPLVDYFSRKVCRSCQYFNRCWQGDLFGQYRRVLSMFTMARERGSFTEYQIPAKLRKFCPRQREMIKAIGNMREMYQLNSYWQDKVQKSRSLVSEQLEGIAAIMHDLAQELKLELVGEKRSGGNNAVRFALEIGVAQVARNGQNVSGDSYAVLPLKNGKQALILSDGMGSGKEARLASVSTVRLLEHLLGTGFRREVAINTLNTLLRLGYPSERFATLDLALLNLQVGEVELYKLGAAPSFLKRGGVIKTIGSVSLPIGILEEVALEKNCLNLPEGGILIMVTDGMLDAGPGNEKDWFDKALREIRHDHPQIIADRLIEEACYRWPQGVRDDLTVLVSRLKPYI